MGWDQLFGGVVSGLYVAPEFIEAKKLMFFGTSVPKIQILEVDLVCRTPGAPLTVGITHLADDGKYLKVTSAVVPRDVRNNVYKMLEDFGYPVKEFHEPYRMSESRQRLEELLNTRPSLLDIEPREIHSYLSD